MEEIIVVVFDSELRALEGLKILRELDHDNEITLYQAQAVSKGTGGAVRVMEDVDTQRLPLIGGTGLVGALIGVLGGPLGVIAGASVGGLVGSLGDLKEEGIDEKFFDDVKLALAPDKSAIIADIEQWVESVDTRMRQIGGVVLRHHVRNVVELSEKDFDADAHRAEMEQLQAERTQARAGRLAAIDARIDHLRAKIENSIEHRRAKAQLRRQEREARIKALESKAAASQGEIRRRQQARVAELRRDYSLKTNAG